MMVRAGQYLNTLYLNTVFKYIYCIYTLYLNTFFNLYLIAVFKRVISAKMIKIIKFLFFAQKVSSGMGALRPKFLGG